MHTWGNFQEGLLKSQALLALTVSSSIIGPYMVERQFRSVNEANACRDGCHHKRATDTWNLVLETCATAVRVGRSEARFARMALRITVGMFKAISSGNTAATWVFSNRPRIARTVCLKYKVCNNEGDWKQYCLQSWHLWMGYIAWLLSKAGLAYFRGDSVLLVA
jgi:hypothetical protein